MCNSLSRQPAGIIQAARPLSTPVDAARPAMPPVFPSSGSEKPCGRCHNRFTYGKMEASAPTGEQPDHAEQYYIGEFMDVEILRRAPLFATLDDDVFAALTDELTEVDLS